MPFWGFDFCPEKKNVAEQLYIACKVSGNLRHEKKIQKYYGI